MAGHAGGQITRSEPQRVLVVGGGAAGFFAAITAAETHPGVPVQLLERGANVLAKVKVSGGGRCNVTHSCFDPSLLVTHYPRGGAELRGPFTRFQPRDTVEWFESRGVPLKTEEDNRIFPKSDRSESIIECLKAEAARVGVAVRLNAHIQKIETSPTPLSGGPPSPDGRGHSLAASPLLSGEGSGVRSLFRIHLGTDILECDRLILATGSNPQGWEWARALGHDLIPPVPSLFTFTINDPRLKDLAGISVPDGVVSLKEGTLHARGPVLITHEGLSGPAVLKLSAWAARDLHACGYRAELEVNWTGERLDPQWDRLKKKRAAHGQNLILADNVKEVPRRLFARLALAAGIPERSRWTEVSNEALKVLAKELTAGVYTLEGKSTFKEEFVTAGGVSLEEVDFRTMQSKRCPGLYFAGEILNIDAETGGFNFQNAWTTGWLAGTRV